MIHPTASDIGRAVLHHTRYREKPMPGEITSVTPHAIYVRFGPSKPEGVAIAPDELAWPPDPAPPTQPAFSGAGARVLARSILGAPRSWWDRQHPVAKAVVFFAGVFVVSAFGLAVTS